MDLPLGAPERGRLAARLARWSRESPADARCTVVVRPEYSAALETAGRDLEARGAHVESAGPGAIVVVVTPDALRAVAELPWVKAVEEPRRLERRFPER